MSLLKRPGLPRNGGLASSTDSAARLRWGLTGMAAIFLLVLVAAAGLRPDKPSAVAAQPQNEPLAVLGVAPSSGPATPAPAAVPRQGQ